MENNVKGKYTRTGFISYQTSEIKKLVKTGNIKKAQSIINQLISEYPHDYQLLKLQAWLYVIYKMYEEAYAIYELLEIYEENREPNSIRLATMAIKLYDYPKMKCVYEKYFKNKKDVCEVSFYDFEMIRIYLEKIFEPYKKHKSILNGYGVNQMIEYNQKAAIENIIERHTKPNEASISLFRSDINIEELMIKVTKLLDENHDKAIIYKNYEVYYVFMPHCGHYPNSEDNNLNTLKVHTIYNTSNILTMYPVEDLYKNSLIYFEEEYDKKKRLSPIDKFNSKYNLK